MAAPTTGCFHEVGIRFCSQRLSQTSSIGPPYEVDPPVSGGETEKLPRVTQHGGAELESKPRQGSTETTLGSVMMSPPHDLSPETRYRQPRSQGCLVPISVTEFSKHFSTSQRKIKEQIFPGHFEI